MSEYIEIDVPADLNRPMYDLVGHDSNAGAIIGGIRRALKNEGNSKEVVDSFTMQAMAGDYDHLLRVAMSFIEQVDDD